MSLEIICQKPLVVNDTEISVEELNIAVTSTNSKLKKIKYSQSGINIFSIIDFRVLSGMVGELFSKELSDHTGKVKKNPYLNGYPDLLNVSTSDLLNYFQNCKTSDFIRYKFGGLEVKNSFGTKKSKSYLQNGDQRIDNINSKIDWKAHHRETNHLVGLLSDFIDFVPQIVALMYSDKLNQLDWNKVQKPKGDSAMTSFSVISNSGFKKMIDGLRLCNSDLKYLSFLKRSNVN